jgi:hypothetical protein
MQIFDIFGGHLAEGGHIAAGSAELAIINAAGQAWRIRIKR